MKKPREYLGWIKRDYELTSKEVMEVIANGYGLRLSVAENIPYKKMNEWYNSLKMFASYPPEYTGFNMCWMEAKAAGVPKILGNDYGIGSWRAESDYKAPIFTWKYHVDQLLEVFGGENVW